LNRPRETPRKKAGQTIWSVPPSCVCTAGWHGHRDGLVLDQHGDHRHRADGLRRLGAGLVPSRRIVLGGGSPRGRAASKVV